ncbi:YgfZ/GcvT domain-containing protein [Halochromatium salexigens]|uniref:Folate-binding protein YgfZ n=1 Tax=Halochromatium salexigens TaxID=49447 RepID=A0AAJ0UHH8_HALSE|nr:folate-binding protein YgfZ [Halochromatium salexigens]MBK5931578.1 folate-binding protein YgfZ [Halochromatium salexigens]
MHQDWQAFLESQGARIGDDGAARFDHAAAEPDCAVVDLSHLGLIAVSGPEATEFLQGQLSNDLRELSETHSQLNSHCSPKGRMLANFRMLRLEQTLFLLLPRVQMETLLKRLRLFLLRAKATIDEASDALVCLGIVGDGADESLTHAFGSLPSEPNAMVRAGDTALIRVADPTSRYLLIGPVESARAAWEAARAAGAEPANPDLWALRDIRAGLPTVWPETSDSFVPQMANMHLIDGVSFHKGCYTGQEVVARMQYLGKLKRRMYLAQSRLDADAEPPAPGTPLASPASSSEQAPGRVVEARRTASGACEMLVVAEIQAAEAGELRLGEDGPMLRISPPPYGFPANV